MQTTYAEALTPGTLKNKANQARLYIKFMLIYKFDFLKPSVAQLAMYCQFLANSFVAPATRANYLSGTKSLVLYHCGSIEAFSSLDLYTLSKTNENKSKHVLAPAAPLLPEHIKTICSYVDSSSLPLAIKPCLLIAFSAFLRASNIVSPSLQVWGCPHTLPVKDILDINGELCLIIRSSKPSKVLNQLLL